MSAITQADFYIKRGDRLPVLARQLKFDSGDAIDLTGCTVTWTMVNAKTRVVKATGAATITNALEGRVEYAWASLDTDTVDSYIGEWRITYPDAKTLRVPTLNFVNVHVKESLA